MTRAIDIPCPRCAAATGVRCINAQGKPFAGTGDAHHQRRVAARTHARDLSELLTNEQIERIRAARRIALSNNPNVMLDWCKSNIAHLASVALRLNTALSRELAGSAGRKKKSQ